MLCVALGALRILLNTSTGVSFTLCLSRWLRCKFPDMPTSKSVSCRVSTTNCNHELNVLNSALYGKPYIEAAKDTWRLFKDRGTPSHALSL